MTATQAAEEQLAIDEVYRRLDEQRRHTQRRSVSVLEAPAEGAGELAARDQEVRRLSRLSAVLAASDAAICFGRTDAEDGTALRIGRLGIRDDSGELLLVDWRAEAARAFYAATAVTPMGLRRRRHLRMVGRAVRAVTDEILDGSHPTHADVVGDGPLVEALSTARTGRMREAVSTLQTEQDSIVRSEHRGVSVVHGGPGTGKTIVAMHRAAYVLYAFPGVADQGVMVFGPNQRFLDYIGDVLPSLGENDVRLVTASDLVKVALASEADPHAVWKGRSQTGDALARWITAQQPSDKPIVVRVGQDTVTLSSATVSRAVRSARQDSRAHNIAREHFLEYVAEDVVDELEIQASQTMAQIDADVSTMLGIDVAHAADSDLRSLGFEADDGAANELHFDRDGILAALQEDPAFDALIERSWPRLDAETVLRDFLDDHEALLPEGDFSAADVALLDEARALIDGPPDDVFGHVVVDEAQELTEMEWRMIMRRCPSASMTVVGDLAQSGSATTVRSWSQALQQIDPARIRVHALTVNYRTTAEIIEATAPLLAEIAPDQTSSISLRHGEEPRRIAIAGRPAVHAVRETVLEALKSTPGELVGVICAVEDVTELREALSTRGVEVVAAADVRGLEFDTVVIVDPARIRQSRAAGTHDLYVAMTRATKRLWILE